MNSAIEASLKTWHAIVAGGNTGPLRALLAPDCVFRSPVAYQPYHGADRTERVLAAAASVFEDFRYRRQFVVGNDAVLEFSARIGAVELKGVDLIHFDDAGRITEFEVMVRPASGLQALGQAMAQRLGGPP